MLRLYDTALGEVVEVLAPGRRECSLYVCGPTVYDVPHLGHGRSALVYDVLRRYVESQGTRMHHVSNVTDIDDKIVQRAIWDGIPAGEVAERYEAAWWEAVDRLGVLRPHDVPHATEYVAEMIQAIGDLESAGVTYLVPGERGGVYFDTSCVADYGLLKGQEMSSLRAGARVETDSGKRSPHDFALWKVVPESEPSWESPWGKGRPGWHTECVVMSLGLLGEGFDLHAGGLDLLFPHHENERAQAVALGRRFALHWFHHGFVEVGGQKMAKSLGNYTSLDELLEHEDSRAYRTLVLRSHYRSPLEVTQASLADASAALARLDGLVRRVPEALEVAGPTGLAGLAGVNARKATVLQL